MDWDTIIEARSNFGISAHCKCDGMHKWFFQGVKFYEVCCKA